MTELKLLSSTYSFHKKYKSKIIGSRNPNIEVQSGIPQAIFELVTNAETAEDIPVILKQAESIYTSYAEDLIERVIVDYSH
jgi:hypothetical protein